MRPLALFLVLLLAGPASAQVIPSAFGGGGGGGGGGGNVTGTFTTGVVPMGTAAHTLGDSLNAVMPGSNGALGFNNAGNAEAVIGTASLNNAGIFAGGPSVFTIHDSVEEPGSQLLIYNQGDGIVNAVALEVYGTYPSNGLNLIWGNGAGAAAPNGTVIFQPDTILFQLPDTSGVGVFEYLVKQAALTADHEVMIYAKKNTGSFIQTSNSVDTARGQISTNILVGPTSTHVLTALDSLDATGDVSIGVYSPTANGGIGAVKIGNTQTGAGTAAQLHLLSPGGLHGVIAFKAPDVVTGDATTVYTLPVAFPAANGQPLVSTTAGVMSFSAGKTQAYVVCTGAACATSCTLTFTGGILTANSGTCP